MIDKNGIDLANRDIDGVTTPEEHARLLAMMDSNEDLRKLHQDLQRLSTTLSGVEGKEAPPGLKHSIMRELQAPQASPVRIPLVERVVNAGRIWWSWQRGLIFAGGVVAGLLVFAIGASIFQSSSIRENDLAGTLSIRGSAGDFTDAASFGISEGASQGVITASYGRELCLLRVTFRAPGVSQTELSYDAAAVQLSAIRPSSDIASRLEILPGKITVSGGPVSDLVAVFSTHSSAQAVVRVRVTGIDGAVAERLIPVVSQERH
jgi:hypothetical protein